LSRKNLFPADVSLDRGNLTIRQVLNLTYYRAGVLKKSYTCLPSGMAVTFFCPSNSGKMNERKKTILASGKGFPPTKKGIRRGSI